MATKSNFMVTEKNFNERMALGVLEKRIKKTTGKKCKDFMFSCWSCEVYMALDILKAWIETLEEDK